MMAYTVDWQHLDQAIELTIHGQPTLEELQAINEEVSHVLDGIDTRVSILIDTVDLTAGYETANQLRDTQHYMNHPKLDRILVVATNKLNRLITLLAFCTARARLVQYDDPRKARANLKLS